MQIMWKVEGDVGTCVRGMWGMKVGRGRMAECGGVSIR